MTYEVKKTRVIPSSSASMKTPIADKLIAERAAVEKANVEAFAKGFVQGANEAVRDCIAVVEHLHDYEAPHDAHRDALWNAITALRALLEDK